MGVCLYDDDNDDRDDDGKRGDFIHLEQVDDLLKRLDYLENDWNVLVGAPRRWDTTILYFFVSGIGIGILTTSQVGTIPLTRVSRPGLERGVSEISGVTERSDLFIPFQNKAEV